MPRHHSTVLFPNHPHAFCVPLIILLLLFRSSISLQVGEFSRFKPRLSIDYGPNIIGIAGSDILGYIRPRQTISNGGNLTALAHQILDLAKTDSAKEIILGIPLDSNGKVSYGVRNFNGRLCLNFSRVLACIANHRCPGTNIVLVDERYTTKEAKQRLASSKIKASLDAMSAVCLLERYVEDEGWGSLSAEPCSYPPPAELEIFDYNVVKRHIQDLYYSSDSASSGGAIGATNSQQQQKQSIRRIFRPPQNSDSME